VTASSDVPLYMSYSPSDLLDHRLDVSCRLHAAQVQSSGSAAPPHSTAVTQSSTSVDILQHELSLLHAELMFEKQRHEVHARRGRRLLTRVNQLNSFADQNEAMVRACTMTATHRDGHKPWQLHTMMTTTMTATNHDGHSYDGHKPLATTITATNHDGHKPWWPQVIPWQPQQWKHEKLTAYFYSHIIFRKHDCGRHSCGRHGHGLWPSLSNPDGEKHCPCQRMTGCDGGIFFGCILWWASFFTPNEILKDTVKILRELCARYYVPSL